MRATSIWCFVAAMLLISHAAPAIPPLLPASFTQDFIDLQPSADKGWQVPQQTMGVWYLAQPFLTNFSGAIEVYQKMNSTQDMLCGTTGFAKDDTCYIYSNNDIGTKYIVFPGQSKCCNCCPISKCGGGLRRDFLSFSNATFMGDTVAAGKYAKWWSMQGADLNYWFTSIEDGSPVAYETLVNQSATEKVIFGARYLGPLPTEVTKLPSYCEGSALCQGFCSYFR